MCIKALCTYKFTNTGNCGEIGRRTKNILADGPNFIGWLVVIITCGKQTACFLLLYTSNWEGGHGTNKMMSS